MKVFKYIGLLLTAFIASIFIGALFLPNSLKVEKKIIINAPLTEVFSMVNDFRNWQKWSPWADSNFLFQYTDTTSGPGARVFWESKRHGIGEMTTVNWVENELVRNRIYYSKTNSTSFISISLNRLPSGIEVTLLTENSGYSYPFGRFAAKLIQRGLKESFENGLKKLKAVLESKDKIQLNQNITVEVIGCEPRLYLAIIDSGNSLETKAQMARNYQELSTFLKKQKNESCGFPVSFWYYYNPNGISKYAVAMPISKKLKCSGRLQIIEFAATKAAFVTHKGDYASSYTAWTTVDSYVAEQKMTENGAPWEEYIIGPAQNPDSSQWVTNIYVPIK